MSQPGQLSHGMPPREPIKELSRRILDLERQQREMHGMIVQAANTANRAIGNMTAENWFLQNYALSTSDTAIVNQTISVPVGYTRCGIVAVASAAAINSSAAADNLILRIRVAGTTSLGNYASSTGGTGTTATVSNEWTFAGPIGGDPTDPSRTMNLQLRMQTQNSNWATSAGNWAQLAVLIVWQP